MSDQEDKFIRCLKFDQSSKNLCVGTRYGVRFIDYSDPLNLRCAPKHLYKKIYLLELVPRTDTLIYVTDEDRKKLFFYNLKDHTNTLDPLDPKTYSQSIVRIKATRERIIVAVEDAIFIYAGVLLDMKLLNQINLPGKISENIVDLSEHPVNSYVAYPNFDRIGQFIIADSAAPDRKTIIQAHDSALVAITFDPNGRSVASASENGILIKVHRTFNGECIFEFKRGVTLNISITSLFFSKDAKFLCASDSTNILKIYKLDYSAAVVTTGTAWIRELFQRAVELVLPENASRILFHEDPFARAKLPESSVCKIVSAIQKDKNDDSHLLVAKMDGLLYVYSIDTVNGGQCELLKSFNIVDGKYVETAESWVMV